MFWSQFSHVINDKSQLTYRFHIDIKKSEWRQFILLEPTSVNADRSSTLEQLCYFNTLSLYLTIVWIGQVFVFGKTARVLHNSD